MSYSQYEEQQYILEFFGNSIGRYLDVGAADGITFSNVYQLLLNGWSGISVEPDTKTFRDLMYNYERFADHTELLMAVVDTDEHFVTFYENGQLSSISEEHMARWEQHRIEHNASWIPVTHKTITLNSLFQYSNNFDFISVDIEGNNLQVVKATDWNLVPNCKLLCIEHDNQDIELIEYLTNYGFTQYKRTPVNLLMARNNV